MERIEVEVRTDVVYVSFVDRQESMYFSLEGAANLVAKIITAIDESRPEPEPVRPIAVREPYSYRASAEWGRVTAHGSESEFLGVEVAAKGKPSFCTTFRKGASFVLRSSISGRFYACGGYLFSEVEAIAIAKAMVEFFGKDNVHSTVLELLSAQGGS